MASADLKVNAILINAATVRPGDTLVLVTDARLTDADAAAVSREIADRLPGVSVVFVDGVSQALVYRPEEVPE